MFKPRRRRCRAAAVDIGKHRRAESGDAVASGAVTLAGVLRKRRVHARRCVAELVPARSRRRAGDVSPARRVRASARRSRCRRLVRPVSNRCAGCELIDRYRATITWAPNFAFGLVNAQGSAIAAKPLDLSSMRFILNGGEAIVARTARRFLEMLAPHGLPGDAMRPRLGHVETCSGVTSSHLLHACRRPATRTRRSRSGPPIAGIAIRIVDGRRSGGAEERIGRLQVQGRAR